MARSHFSLGQSTFNCRCCGRLTRDVGDNGSLELCPHCFQMAGWDNQHNDGGTTPTPEQMSLYEAYLKCIAEHGGNAQAVKDSCNYIWQ